jgi:hypothetical protein
MQTNPTSSEQVIYGIQLWMLNCLYWDGHNYRWAPHHRAVAPEQRGKIAVAVNRALKHRFSGPDEVSDAGRREGNPHRMALSSLNDLRALLPRGATVSTYFVSETRTAMASRLLVFAVVQGEIIPLARSAAAVLELQEYAGQVVVPAPRAAAGAHLVALLARALHADPRALRHHSLEGGH